MRQSGILQQCRAICLCLFDYANDHGGHYPDGKTSTEVFQKLIDEGYVDAPSHEEEMSDQNLFYIPMPGKVKPTSKTLKPENVCWDVTSGLTVISPTDTPICYVTGYKISYTPGSRATPGKWPAPTFWTWLTADDFPRGYIVVGYMNDANHIVKASPDGTIPDFVHADANLVSENYRQLTPDGKEPQ